MTSEDLEQLRHLIAEAEQRLDQVEAEQAPTSLLEYLYILS